MSQSTIERGLTCKSLRFFDNKEDLELDKWSPLCQTLHPHRLQTYSPHLPDAIFFFWEHEGNKCLRSLGDWETVVMPTKPRVPNFCVSWETLQMCGLVKSDLRGSLLDTTLIDVMPLPVPTLPLAEESRELGISLQKDIELYKIFLPCKAPWSCVFVSAHAMHSQWWYTLEWWYMCSI
jgi:hypothetical protein